MHYLNYLRITGRQENYMFTPSSEDGWYFMMYIRQLLEKSFNPLTVVIKLVIMSF